MVATVSPSLPCLSPLPRCLQMVCTTLYECLIAVANFGIRRGGGIGDDFAKYGVDTTDWWYRQLLFDMAYVLAQMCLC